jgi:hypothetical protein
VNVPARVAVRIGGPAVELPAFILADGSRPARQQTRASIAATSTALEVRFLCDDRDPWGTLEDRDDPLWSEECVEVFLAAGDADPVEYFEFELSPPGVLFDARIRNPTGHRRDMSADTRWNCAGLEGMARTDAASHRWRAELRIPWGGLGFPDSVPRSWRLNVFRIDRPRDGRPHEFSCWVPTLTDPPDFHVPSRFGFLEIAPGD